MKAREITGRDIAVQHFETLIAGFEAEYARNADVLTYEESTYRRKAALSNMLRVRKQIDSLIALMGAVEDALDGVDEFEINDNLLHGRYVLER